MLAGARAEVVLRPTGVTQLQPKAISARRDLHRLRILCAAVAFAAEVLVDISVGVRIPPEMVLKPAGRAGNPHDGRVLGGTLVAHFRRIEIVTHSRVVEHVTIALALGKPEPAAD